jgi:hypothetical protein
MIEGHMQNKLKFIYALYDVNQKGYLDSITYERVLNHIVNTAVIYNNGGYHAFFNDDCDRFFQTFRNHEKLKNPEKVKFSDIGESLSKSPFILTHCREKKKKGSIIRSKTAGADPSNSDNPFNLPEHLLQAHTIIEETKEEHDDSKSISSQSDNEEDKPIEDVQLPATESEETTPEKEENTEAQDSGDKASDEKKTIYVEHLNAKSAISAWAEREKAAQEQLKARKSITQRPSIMKSKSSITEKPVEKPIERVVERLVEDTPVLKLEEKKPLPEPEPQPEPVEVIYDNFLDPCPTSEPADKNDLSFPYKPDTSIKAQVIVEATEEFPNPGPLICRSDYITPTAVDTNIEVSFLESFAFKRDSSVTPQGPVEKTPSSNKCEKPVPVTVTINVPQPVVVGEVVTDRKTTTEEPANDFLNEAALNRKTLTDEEKEVRKQRAATDAKQAQDAACKVCNIF